MRHRVSGYKLGRSRGHRTAMRRTLVTEFFRHERIKTTKTKAAAIRDEAERLITRAKVGVAAGESRAVSARRLAAARLNDPQVVKKLFDEIAPRYAARPGGYTRVVKLGARHGDAAEMVYLELVEE
jgi:large subunit ribosomal protein L17